MQLSSLLKMGSAVKVEPVVSTFVVTIDLMHGDADGHSTRCHKTTDPMVVDAWLEALKLGFTKGVDWYDQLKLDAAAEEVFKKYGYDRDGGDFWLDFVGWDSTSDYNYYATIEAVSVRWFDADGKEWKVKFPRGFPTQMKQ